MRHSFSCFEGLIRESALPVSKIYLTYLLIFKLLKISEDHQHEYKLPEYSKGSLGVASNHKMMEVCFTCAGLVWDYCF